MFGVEITDHYVVYDHDKQCRDVGSLYPAIDINPNATVLDSKAKKQKELEWIDRIEEFDAFMND